jgi:hypothetical protein
MPSAIRRIHSRYLGDKAFPKDNTEFEIREFFTLSAADLRAIVSVRPSFQLPTFLAPRMNPNSISVRRASPRHITMLPGGGSLARAR